MPKTRPTRADIGFIVVGVLIVLSALALAARNRGEGRARIAALRVCLVGHGSFDIDDTVTAVRRIEAAPISDRCVELAREVARDRLTTFTDSKIARAASRIETKTPTADLIALLDLTDGYARGEPSRGTDLWPILDREIAKHRGALEGFVPEDTGYRSESIAFPSGRGMLRVEAGGGRPLAALAYESNTERTRVLREGGRMIVDPSRKDLGPGEPLFVFEPWVFFRRAEPPNPGEKGEPGPIEMIAAKFDGSVEFTFSLDVKSHAACRDPKGSAVVLTTSTEAHVLIVEASQVVRVGSMKLPEVGENGSRGPVSVSCIEGDMIVQTALSLPAPGTWSYPDMGGRYGALPREPQRHRLSRMFCTRRGCDKTEDLEIEGLDCSYPSTGGWSSALVLGAPSLVDLGARTLVYWSSGDAIHFRSSPWASLGAAETRSLVEVTHTDEGIPTRALSFARATHASRGPVALLFIEESGPARSVFPVRFDATGDVTPLFAD